MLNVLVIPAWYDISNPLTGIFFHDYCNALTSQSNVTLLNFTNHSFSERFKSSQKEDKILDKKYKFISFDYYNSIPGKWASLSVILQKYWIKRRAISIIADYMKKEGRFDVIHIQSVCNNMTPLIAVALSEYFNIPYIVTEHYTSFMEAGNIFYKPFTTFSEIKTIVKQASMRIAVSNYASNYCANCFDANFITVYNIISNNYLELPIKKSSNSAQRFNYLCIGSFQHRKGQTYLIRAFAEIVDKNKNSSLTLVGSGADEAAIRQLVVELGIEKSVTILDYFPSNELIKIIDEAQVIVSASSYETFGITIVEGFFRGKPALVTRSGGPEELVNETNGLITDFADVTGMAKNMKYIYEHYNEYNPKTIREDASKKFSAKAIVPLMIENYTNVVNKHIKTPRTHI